MNEKAGFLDPKNVRQCIDHFLSLSRVESCDLYRSAWIVFVECTLDKSFILLSQIFVLVLELYHNAIADHSSNERG
jgi:hypothetical protein